MARPKVFVIVLSWNSAARIRRCLDSLAGLHYENREVIVVDNGSKDASPEIVRAEYPSFRVIENESNLGYTGGNNIGIAYALANGADYVWLFNDDASAEADTLDQLIAVTEADSRLGLVSPVICFRQQPERVQFAGSYFDDRQFDIVATSQPSEIQSWMLSRPDKVLLWGTAMLIRADVIRKIGPLDDAYFAYYEDSDFCMRAICNGYHAQMVLTARVLHESYQTTVARPPHFHYLMIRNEYRFWLSHLPLQSRIRFRRKYLVKTMRTLGKCKESASPEHVDACIAGLWDALCGVYGPRDNARQMPVLLRKALVWRPYLLSMLFGGDLSRIAAELAARLRRSKAGSKH